MTPSIGKKIVKIILITILAITLLVGGATIFIVKTVDQNTIKNKTTQLVRDKTGRELKINGDISWTFFPWLGIKIQNVSLSNPPNFKDGYFAEVTEADANIRLLPLIFGQIEVGHLTLKNLNLQLIKNSLGKGNWQGLSAPTDAPTTVTTTKDHKIDAASFIVGDITINNGSIFWQDQKTNKQIKINKFDLHCKNISLKQPFDISTSFHLNDLTSSLNGEVTVNTQVKLDLEKNWYEFKNFQLGGNLKNKDGKRFLNLKGEADVKLDLEKQLLTTNALKLNIVGTTITGSLQCSTLLTNPNFSGNLTASNANAEELIQLIGINKYFKKAVTASFKIALTISANVVKLKTIETHLNDTTLQGSAEYTMDNANLQLALSNVPMQTLLIDLAKYEKFSGTLSLNTNINVNNLTGNGNVLISQGSYRGIDIPYEVRRAHTILNTKPLPAKPQTPHTDFDKLTMSFKINNGTLSTDDLLIQAPDYKVTGRGNANLLAKNLDFSLSAYSTHDENFFVPIKVTGAFTDPSVKFDTTVMLQYAAKKAIKDVIQKQLDKHLPNIQQQINKILPLNNLLH
jgi:AsmA protein